MILTIVIILGLIVLLREFFEFKNQGKKKLFLKQCENLHRLRMEIVQGNPNSPYLQELLLQEIFFFMRFLNAVRFPSPEQKQHLNFLLSKVPDGRIFK